MITATQRLLTGRARLPGFSDEWKKKRFGDICTFLSTANNPRADLEEHGTIGYIHYGSIHAHPLPVLNCASHDLPRIEESRVGNAARLRDGDLVMVDASEDLEGLGKSVEVIGVGNDDVVAGLHTILCRGGSDHWAAGFKAYLQYVPSFKSALTRVATGISVYAVSKKQLADIVLVLPSPDEQRAISEALSDVDGLLELLESLIAKKRAVKTGAMQQLLTGKMRLPGFRGEWRTKRLGEIANIDPENLSDDTNPDYEFNYISLEQVETGRLRGYTEETFRSSPSRARRKLRHNDVLMSTVRPNLMGHLLFNEQSADTVCSTGFAVLRCKDSLSVPEFLFAHLLGSVVNKQIEAVLAGSNYPAISSCDVALVEIPCPPTVREQAAIGTILSDMDAEIATLECRLDKGRALKQGMVQQLLTGKIRLVDTA